MELSKTKFYTFTQNNSGGSFVIDEYSGICGYVIIEANSHIQANEIALNIGLYFDGCDSGIDCSCCGDRWYEVDEDYSEITPCIYGESVFSLQKSIFKEMCFIHYINGEVEKVEFKSNPND